MIDIPTTKGKGGWHVIITAASGLICLLLIVACNSPGDSGGPAEHLNAFCIRECVVETGDSEICDTRCKCAVEKLASALSVKELSELADGITRDRESGNEDIDKLRSAMESCVSEN